MKKCIVAVFIILCISVLNVVTIFSPTSMPIKAEFIEEMKPTISVIYTSLGVPDINSSFKTYMDYRTITDKLSKQYTFIKTWGWSDNNGFMRVNGERDLGINDDYYMIALGSYYGTEIGTKYKITTDTGNVFYGILCDCKADRHTNFTNQYSYNNDIVEFIIDSKKLNSDIKKIGSANVYMPLNGNISIVEKIDFVWKGGK